MANGRGTIWFIFFGLAKFFFFKAEKERRLKREKNPPKIGFCFFGAFWDFDGRGGFGALIWGFFFPRVPPEGGNFWKGIGTFLKKGKVLPEWLWERKNFFNKVFLKLNF